ncbi:hypothetical protein LZ30DRAFT_724111, partial [Colletotrichum cereale]
MTFSALIITLLLIIPCNNHDENKNLIQMFLVEVCGGVPDARCDNRPSVDSMPPLEEVKGHTVAFDQDPIEMRARDHGHGSVKKGACGKGVTVEKGGSIINVTCSGRNIDENFEKKERKRRNGRALSMSSER